MIGIVVVSHSRALAEAAVALASEMTGSGAGPAVEVAAGLDATTSGTDAVAVAEAVTRADGGDGVLVLLDLGSAVLSAEMALELLEPELAQRVRLSAAPLVEGLVGAVVAAAAGADLDTAATEAERGLVAKAHHLGAGAASAHGAAPTQGTASTHGAASTPGVAPTPGAAPAAGAAGQDGAPSVRHTGDELSRELPVTAPHGLHARPAARFVREVGAYPGARVQVRNLTSAGAPVDGRSLTGLATLGALQGHRLEVVASGEGAAELLDALTVLAGRAFGDRGSGDRRVNGPAPGDVAAPSAERAGGAGRGDAPGAASDQHVVTGPVPVVGPTHGLDAAVGRVVRAGAPVSLEDYRPGDVEQELAALDRALTRVRAELSELVDGTAARLGGDRAAVFEAHLAMLDDPALVGPLRDDIREGATAPEAVAEHTARLRTLFDRLTDPYQRERGADVGSVGQRLLRALSGHESPSHESGGVLVVQELDPGTAVLLDPTQILGVITVGGAATGHGVLLARSRGLPVLTGATAAADLADGTLVAFDARSGRLAVDPDVEVRGEFEALLSERVTVRDRMIAGAAEPAVTTDGHHVPVRANIGGVAEAALAASSGADGSGLVRTEALFGSCDTAPSVAEQVSTFARIARDLSGATITIRTWDVGGDKPLPFHPQPAEANPYLGQRGVRAFRQDPALLVDQLEAVCRVARETPVRVMFPMVSTVEEVDWALARLEEAAGRVPGGRPDSLEVGIMVEVPAAALRPEALTTQLDFVSIGSNDLTQYTLAAERGNPALDSLADAADPAVLQLIRDTVLGVAEGVEVCLCGEAASDPGLAQLLVGLGVGELSATAASVPAVKDALRRVSLTDLQDLAQRALRAESAAEVRDLLVGRSPYGPGELGRR